MKNFCEANAMEMVVQLNKYSCGVSPNGDVVYASSAAEASNLHHRYSSGEYGLKDTLYIPNEPYSYYNDLELIKVVN